MILSWW